MRLHVNGKVESETVYEKGNYSDIFFFSRSLSLFISVGFYCVPLNMFAMVFCYYCYFFPFLLLAAAVAAAVA